MCFFPPCQYPPPAPPTLPSPRLLLSSCPPNHPPENLDLILDLILDQDQVQESRSRSWTGPVDEFQNLVQDQVQDIF